MSLYKISRTVSASVQLVFTYNFIETLGFGWMLNGMQWPECIGSRNVLYWVNAAYTQQLYDTDPLNDRSLQAR